MKSGKFIWMDGRFISANNAGIEFLTHGLHYGSAVYEGIRAYETSRGPADFRLSDHIARLTHSAAAIGIKIPYSRKTLEHAAVGLIKKNGFRECYLRPLVFYGEGEMRLTPANAKIHIAIGAWPWGAYLGEHPALSVCVSPFIRFHPRSTVVGAKISGLYAVSVMATIDARKRGFDECIMLDYEGNVAEGPGENIFIVKNKKILTPDSSSILKGITRATIISIAHDMKMEVREKKITLAELRKADEAFFTGTATEVAPIAKIDGHRIGSGSVGPITTKLRDAYRAITHGEEKKYAKWLT